MINLSHSSKLTVPAAPMLTDLHQTTFIALATLWSLSNPVPKCQSVPWPTILFSFGHFYCSALLWLLLSDCVKQHCCTLWATLFPVNVLSLVTWHFHSEYVALCHSQRRVAVHSKPFPQLTTLIAVNWVVRIVPFFASTHFTNIICHCSLSTLTA